MTRTLDLRIRNPLLYPAELRAHFIGKTTRWTEFRPRDSIRFIANDPQAISRPSDPVELARLLRRWLRLLKIRPLFRESSERPCQFRAGMQKPPIAVHWSPIKPFGPPRDGSGESYRAEDWRERDKRRENIRDVIACDSWPDRHHDRADNCKDDRPEFPFQKADDQTNDLNCSDD